MTLNLSGCYMTLNPNDLERQRIWSTETFGPGYRPGTLKHLEEEIAEIRENTDDIEEYADALILILDDAMRAGHSPRDILRAYHAKSMKNRDREWPDWRGRPLDEPINHVRKVGDPMPCEVCGNQVSEYTYHNRLGVAVCHSCPKTDVRGEDITAHTVTLVNL